MVLSGGNYGGWILPDDTMATKVAVLATDGIAWLYEIRRSVRHGTSAVFVGCVDTLDGGVLPDGVETVTPFEPELAPAASA